MTTINFADEPFGRIYDLMSNLVVPRPIAFVSTLSESGIPNLAPFSFFNIGGINPPSLTICTVLDGKGEQKDTCTNIEATGEFVVNLLTRAMAIGMNETSPNFPDHVNEWAYSGFTMLESELVKPARVAESPVQMECTLYQIVPHGDGPGASRYIIGQIHRMHVQAELLNGALITPADLIARLGGPQYLDLANHERFELKRPE